MPNLSRFFALILALALAACAQPGRQLASGAAPSARPPVILVSIDGMRADYLDRGVTPNIAALAASGVRATAMRPSFPSLTFPNHYTMVTGLRPDRNGIVNNTMEDSSIPGVRFSLGNREAVIDRRWWDEAEPIWVTAEKAGIHTATMFWPGSEAPIHGVEPSHFAVFDGKLANDKRVDQLVNWMTGADHPGFGTLYFDMVDHAGHESGPDSPQVTEDARLVDRSIGLLVRRLKQRHIDANIIIVADHGMAATSPDRVVLLDALVPADSFRMVSGGPVAGLEARPGKDAELEAALLAPHDHMQCWRKGEIPARLAYGKNPRVPPYICLAETGWLILGSAPKEPVKTGGAHGYDPAAPEMAAMFVANGPAFRAGTVLRVFDNVDVYPLAMRLLGLPPLPGDGSITPLLPALR
jgi:ectonucleotide pyrophosphatase/phosphodiesterase family protein 5